MPADVPAALNSLIAKRLQFRFRGLKTSQSPEVAKLRTSVWEMLNSNFSGSDARLRLVIADLFDQIGGISICCHCIAFLVAYHICDQVMKLPGALSLSGLSSQRSQTR